MALLVTLATAAGPAAAELIAGDDFEDYAAGSINGSAGGEGWDGAWLGAGGSVQQVVDTSAEPLEYRTSAGEAVVGGARALAFRGNNDLAAYRSIADDRRRREVYVSMLVRFTGTQNANDFVALWFENAGFGAAPNIGVKMNDGTGGSPEDFFARTQANNHVSVVDIEPGRTYFLVGHLSKPNNGRRTVYDEFRLWVDPVSLSTEPPEDAVSRGDSNITEFSRIGFRSVNLDGDDEVIIDRLRIGTSWEDVTTPDVAPVLELAMDETSWNGTPDEVIDSASGWHGSAFGGAVTSRDTPAIAGDPGTCRYGVFDGTDDHVLVDHRGGQNGSDALTYMAWIRPDAWAGTRQVMAKSVHDGGSGRAQMGMFSEGGEFKLRAETGRGRLEVTAPLPAVNRWTHVAGVFSGRRLELYVDGSPVAADNFGPTELIQTTDPLAVGKRVGSNEYFFDGAIDEVRVYTQVLDRPAIEGAMNRTRICRAEPFTAASAFAVSHDGAGIHCLDEPVEVAVLDASSAVLTDYDGEISLTSSTGRGTWSLLSGNGIFADATADDGAASYQFDPADAGRATFALRYREGPALLNVDVFEAADPDIRDTDTEGMLLFAPSGFTVTGNALPNPPPSPIDDPVGTQAAGSTFTMHLAAYGVTEDDPQCGIIESYSASRQLAFTMTYENPDSGPLLATVNDQAVGGAAQPVTFTAGQAEVAVRYKDAGAIALQMSDSGSFDNVVSGASNTFVVQPAALVFTTIRAADGTPNPGAVSTAGDAFTAAGEPFEVEVEARDAEGDRTPNFGRELPPEGVRVVSDALVFPAGGRNGSTGDVINGAAFGATGVAGRFLNSGVVFDEVGSIRLRPAVADDDYLGSGPVPGAAVDVGRFHPAAFDVLSAQVSAACGAYTYMDQPELGLEFVLQALTAGGSVTENYDAGLLGAAAVAELTLTAEAGDDGVDRGGRLSAVGGTWSAGEVAVDRNDLAFAREAAPDGPFDPLQLGLVVADPLNDALLQGLDSHAGSSGDCLAAGTCDGRALGNPTRVVYGRLAVLPARGPENEDLRVPLAAQIFTGAAFEGHPADACTAYAGADATLSDFSGNLDAGETSVSGPAPAATLLQGAADPDAPLALAAPGFGNDGSVLVTLDVVPWLEFDWHGTGLQNPAATASFGRFRGHDRIIYWGEMP
ncbi:MAG: LamG domain-containing protein [Gammaproteobacteria bacterium]|nr:LamG domain-containing protein [Gammaproteobacteria bacterium]